MRPALLALILSVALATAAATVAYVVGRESADAPASYDRGVADGKRTGRAEIESAYRPGSARYRAIAETGRRRGYAAGRRDGAAAAKRRGTSTARAARTTARDALAGFDWQAGSWYLVTVADRNGALGIGRRIVVRPQQWYGLCSTGGGVCRRVGQTSSSRTTPSRR